MLSILFSAPLFAKSAEVEKDRLEMIEHYKIMLPGINVNEYKNGVYSFDMNRRENWEAIEEFPPYEIAIDSGEELWNAPFENGKFYKNCFSAKSKNHFPRWSKIRGRVVTLSETINFCREKNGEKPLKYGKKEIVNLMAYMANQSKIDQRKIRGIVPVNDDPRSLEAYRSGKEFYWKKRGKLNFSCADCHFKNAGRKLRTQSISMSTGQVSHWPAYRSKWGAVGTLHRRFKGCMKNMRAEPLKLQSEEFKNLEYFLTAISKGVEMNGPGNRE